MRAFILTKALHSASFTTNDFHWLYMDHWNEEDMDSFLAAASRHDVQFRGIYQQRKKRKKFLKQQCQCSDHDPKTPIRHLWLLRKPHCQNLAFVDAQIMGQQFITVHSQLYAANINLNELDFKCAFGFFFSALFIISQANINRIFTATPSWQHLFKQSNWGEERRILLFNTPLWWLAQTTPLAPQQQYVIDAYQFWKFPETQKYKKSLSYLEKRLQENKNPSR